MSKVHTLRVPRTARYVVAGELSAETRDLWFVLHGYGQVAESFAHEFDSIAQPGRVVVAPEGLSRFYLRRGAGDVGASWMTKDAREDEVADYVGYLDAVYEEVLARVDAAPAHPVHVRVLGFSQGSATAYRWSALGSARIDSLIAWAGDLPPDLDLTQLRPPLTLVLGSRDSFVDEKRLAVDLGRLNTAGITHEVIRFEGGHRLDRDTLAAL